MLTCASFGNDARLAHALGQHGLTDHVVDLVSAGVVEVFTLEVDLRAAHFAGHAGCVVDRRGTTHEVGQFGLEFSNEFRIVLVLGIGLTQLIQGVSERFAGKAATVRAKVAAGIGVRVFKHQD